MQLQVKSDFFKNILAFEEFARQQPQIDLKVNNYFSHGVYARELHIPAGVILTGEIHKFSNLNILTKGRIKVSVGDEVELIEAPHVIVSPPGTKRIAKAMTDCVWVTIHGTFETNVDKIKEYFIADNYQDWLEFNDNGQLELPLC